MEFYQQLQIHLSHNHHPPVDICWVPTCIAAIAAYNSGKPKTAIPTPKGTTLSANELIEELHLEYFLDEKGQDQTTARNIKLEVHKRQEEQGWTDATVLSLIFDACDADRDIIEYLDAVIEDSQQED